MSSEEETVQSPHSSESLPFLQREKERHISNLCSDLITGDNNVNTTAHNNKHPLIHYDHRKSAQLRQKWFTPDVTAGLR